MAMPGIGHGSGFPEKAGKKNIFSRMGRMAGF
jgi:hypothetical protein